MALDFKEALLEYDEEVSQLSESDEPEQLMEDLKLKLKQISGQTQKLKNPPNTSDDEALDELKPEVVDFIKSKASFEFLKYAKVLISHHENKKWNLFLETFETQAENFIEDQLKELPSENIDTQRSEYETALKSILEDFPKTPPNKADGFNLPEEQTSELTEFSRALSKFIEELHLKYLANDRSLLLEGFKCRSDAYLRETIRGYEAENDSPQNLETKKNLINAEIEAQISQLENPEKKLEEIHEEVKERTPAKAKSVKRFITRTTSIITLNQSLQLDIQQTKESHIGKMISDAIDTLKSIIHFQESEANSESTLLTDALNEIANSKNGDLINKTAETLASHCLDKKSDIDQSIIKQFASIYSNLPKQLKKPFAAAAQLIPVTPPPLPIAGRFDRLKKWFKRIWRQFFSKNETAYGYDSFKTMVQSATTEIEKQTTQRQRRNSDEIKKLLQDKGEPKDPIGAVAKMEEVMSQHYRLFNFRFFSTLKKHKILLSKVTGITSTEELAVSLSLSKQNNSIGYKAKEDVARIYINAAKKAEEAGIPKSKFQLGNSKREAKTEHTYCYQWYEKAGDLIHETADSRIVNIQARAAFLYIKAQSFSKATTCFLNCIENEMWDFLIGKPAFRGVQPVSEIVGIIKRVQDDNQKKSLLDSIILMHSSAIEKMRKAKENEDNIDDLDNLLNMIDDRQKELNRLVPPPPEKTASAAGNTRHKRSKSFSDIKQEMPTPQENNNGRRFSLTGA